ncbi:MAG: protein-L-isoaspartate(D-aspartate) O-methyltransferase [Xanthomonadales bacterium]|nr:protein-L-isoaspartate(D-aspartate) O-methyltransferase [Xanthomonadales bacterium]
MSPASTLGGSGMTSQRARDRLVARLQAAGIADERVLEVIRRLPRHAFVDEALASRAYEDTALPIGLGQTISQPFIVARMTAALLAAADGVPQRVLEVGTGSGYQAAVLSPLVGEVYTVERIDELLFQARRRFRRLGLKNIRSRHADGHVGWPEEAPFDAIIVTAAAEQLVPALIEQLGDGGVLVAPVGPAGQQQLLRLTRQGDALRRETLDAVSFVPMLGGLA